MLSIAYSRLLITITGLFVRGELDDSELPSCGVDDSSYQVLLIFIFSSVGAQEEIENAFRFIHEASERIEVTVSVI